ncbi:MAG: helicase [Clostridiales bacterium]|jgi:superfamily I DNA and RNA helicase|nr:helicase [Clostridiales bacterium]
MAVKIINGYTGKPVACQKLKAFFLNNDGISGCLYVGYPFIYPLAMTKGNLIDCLLISPEKGFVAFNLIEQETVPSDYAAKQDEIYQMIEWNLKSFGSLLRKRKLAVDINIVTFAPNADAELLPEEDHPLCNEQTLGATLGDMSLSKPELCDEISIAVRTIGKYVRVIERKPVMPGCKGAYCAELEKKPVFVLDHVQIKAALETVEGVQRIRGLSGAGKSTVLALKAAYIHACHPEWKIGVTFCAFSSRERYRSEINLFYRKQTGLIPNWDNITICMAWGSKKGKNETEGMYQIFTSVNSAKFYDHDSAEKELGLTELFGEACERALYDVDYKSKEIFDIIILDEAQEFPESFLRMCHAMLREPKRLVYAYDDMQGSRAPMLPHEDIFGKPVAGVREDSADITLDRCYERPPAILSMAHALALGIYRKPPRGEINLVQMFENIEAWNEFGYEVLEGCLDYGNHVVMGKQPPVQLDDKRIDDQIVFKSFKSQEEHDTWVVQEIKRNMIINGIQARDIMVVVPGLQLLYYGSAKMRNMLNDEMIPYHVVGLNDDEDELWSKEAVAISSLFEARSHVAPMVYVVEAHSKFFTKYDAALVRNFLYVAMTKSTAWVRVVGFGEDMDGLVEEYERIKSKGFLFDFVYPTRQQLSKLRKVFREAGE